jgi:RNA polymerase sigma factor (TIGR02999 family)
MASQRPGDLTQLINTWKAGSADAGDELFRRIGAELRATAHRRLLGGGLRGRLQTTELIDETFLRLVKQRTTEWDSRDHFYAVVTMLMRRVVLDALRYGAAQERAQDRESPITGGFEPPAVVPDTDRALDLDEALASLHEVDPEAHDVFVRRVLYGETFPELLATLDGSSETTVRRRFDFARAWLAVRLSDARFSP